LPDPTIRNFVVNLIVDFQTLSKRYAGHRMSRSEPN